MAKVFFLSLTFDLTDPFKQKDPPELPPYSHVIPFNCIWVTPFAGWGQLRVSNPGHLVWGGCQSSLRRRGGGRRRFTGTSRGGWRWGSPHCFIVDGDVPEIYGTKCVPYQFITGQSRILRDCWQPYLDHRRKSNEVLSFSLKNGTNCVPGEILFFPGQMLKKREQFWGKGGGWQLYFAVNYMLCFKTTLQRSN